MTTETASYREIDWASLSGHELLELTDAALEAGYIPSDEQMEEVRALMASRHPSHLKLRPAPTRSEALH
tara:strand:+ start:381 stop:587 length:207 start_codon:yes stop_codon:yes gene_type:complete